MFGFLTSPAKDVSDPLVSAKSAAAWLRQLPALDVIARQQHVMRAFDGMRQSRRPIDIARVSAIEYLDSALAADRRQLTKQYVENVDAGPKLANRIWQAVYDMSQGFIFAYQASLEAAVSQTGNPRWKPMVPLLFARYLHYYGSDAKLRVARFERWIPAKWMDLHRTYARAAELGVERIPCVMGTASPNATPWTVEQEYLFALLIHQLNTGNLTPTELDWGSAQLRAWSRRLVLEAVPSTQEGFFVDLAGKTGLTRRTGNDSGSMLRYLDTTPLADQLDRAIASLRQAESSDQGLAASVNPLRAVILEKVRPAVAPNVNVDFRRDPRVACTVPAKVRVGLARICRDLASKDLPEASQDSVSGHEQIEVFAVAEAPYARKRLSDEQDSLSATLSSFSDPMWQVKDRSVAGLRIAASGGIGQSLALGALVAVRQSDVTDWVLGVVRRMNKVSVEDVEAGVSIIADRVVSVALRARPDGKFVAGGSGDFAGISTMGDSFEGLYLPPPSRPDKPLSVKTIIVPTQEYAEGRLVTLTTGRSIYTVALRHLVEQRADWSWAAIQIVEKKAREPG
jgi:cyclic-di-GMP-binding protein